MMTLFVLALHSGNAHLQLVDHVNCNPVLKVACFEQLYFSVRSCGVKAWPRENPGVKECKKIRIVANVTGERKVSSICDGIKIALLVAVVEQQYLVRMSCKSLKVGAGHLSLTRRCSSETSSTAT
jgi:hypothetical protein